MKNKLIKCLQFFVIMLSTSLMFSQNVSGKVTDATGPLSGASVLVKGTTNGTQAGIDGAYSLKNVGANAVLVVSFIGMETKEVSVDGKSVVNVFLKDDQQKLKEVVVIGYGSVKKKDATGAIDQISSKKFDNIAATNPATLLRGKLAGVQATQTSGEPGAGVSIKIRGAASIRSGTDPLIVVDGIPLSGGNVSAGGDDLLGSSSARNPLNFINQNDIESISVLKDASSTAIYGSRGANGVIIITTKKGKSKEPEVSFNSSVVSSTLSGKFDLLSSQEFADYSNANDIKKFNKAKAAALLVPGTSEAVANAAGNAAKSNLDKGGRDYSWKDAILRNSLSYNNDFSIAASTDKSSTRLSLASSNVEGIVKNTGLDKYTANITNTNDLFGGALRFETRLGYSAIKDKTVLLSNNAGFIGNQIGAAFYWNPTVPIYKNDGSYNVIGQNFLNPVQLLNSYNDFTNTGRFLGSLKTIMKFSNHFKYEFLMGFENINSVRKSEILPTIQIENVAQATVPGSTVVKYGQATLQNANKFNRTFEHNLVYNNSIGSNLDFDIIGGYSYYDYNADGYTTRGKGFDSKQINLIDNIEGALRQEYRADSYKNRAEIQSYFTRLNVTLFKKLLLTGTVRQDGSTKFGVNKKNAVFPSGAIAYKLVSDKEGFVNDLKLRLNYGKSGNSEFATNIAAPKGSYGLDGVFNAENAKSENLQWESTKTYGAGLDFELIKNRLTGSVDYFYKELDNLVASILPESILPNPSRNKFDNVVGTVQTTGYEFSLNYKIIENDDFNWSISGNASTLKNKFVNTSLFYPTGAINGQGLTGAYSQVLANDLPLYNFYLYEFRGYNAKGASIYADAAGNDSDLGLAAKKFLDKKTPTPTLNLGFSTSFSYKNLDFSTSFYGAFGHYIYNNTKNAYFFKSALDGGRNVIPEVSNSTQSAADPNAPSTKYLEKGDFLRMGNITLGYTLRGKFMERLKIKSARFYVNGDNLLVFTDYSGFDPEVDTDKTLNGIPSQGNDYLSYPRSKSYAFGINVNF
jgi:TonB-dependent starch-binding outer membrane protein SusC